MSKTLGPWTLELEASATFYTDNDSFFIHRRCTSSRSTRCRATSSTSRRSACGRRVDVTYYAGGRPSVDGEEGERLENVRAGGTIAIPVNRLQLRQALRKHRRRRPRRTAASPRVGHRLAVSLGWGTLTCESSFRMAPAASRTPRTSSRCASSGPVDFYDGPPPDKAQLIERLRPAEAVVLDYSEMDAEVLRACERLRFISFLGIGYNSCIDVAEATRRGVAVAYTPDYGATSVAEHALAMILAPDAPHRPGLRERARRPLGARPVPGDGAARQDARHRRAGADRHGDGPPRRRPRDAADRLDAPPVARRVRSTASRSSRSRTCSPPPMW